MSFTSWVDGRIKVAVDEAMTQVDEKIDARIAKTEQAIAQNAENLLSAVTAIPAAAVNAIARLLRLPNVLGSNISAKDINHALGHPEQPPETPN